MSIRTQEAAFVAVGLFWLIALVVVTTTGDGASARDALKTTWPAVTIAALTLTLGLSAVALLWWTSGRDTRFDGLPYLYPTDKRRKHRPGDALPIVIEYAPPEGIRPAQAAVLMFEDAGSREIIATIADLATRGHLAFESQSGAWVFTRLETTETVLPYESIILERLLRGEDRAVVADTTSHDWFEARRARRAMFRDAVERGWIEEDPEVRRQRWSGWAGVLILAVPPLVLLLGTAFGLGYAAVALAPVAAALWRASRSMPVRTADGSEMLRRVLGFKLYVEKAESARLAFGERERIYHDYAGYGVAFRLTNEWAEGMRSIAETDPDGVTRRPTPSDTIGDLMGSLFQPWST